MNELHTMPLKLERLFSSRKCRNMSLQQFGAFMRFLCEAWLEGAQLPDREDELRQILGKDGQCDRIWADVKANVCDRMFNSDGDGKLYNDTQRSLYAETLARTQKHSAAGRAGAEARWHSDDATAMRPHSDGSAIGMASKAKAKAKEEEPPSRKSAPRGATKPRAPTFKKPTLEDVTAYIAEIEADVDPQAFLDHYTANGWRVGKNPMRDWKATVRTWKRNEYGTGPGRKSRTMGKDGIDIGW